MSLQLDSPTPEGVLVQSRPRVAALLNLSAAMLEFGGTEQLRDAVRLAFEHHGIPAEVTLLAGADLPAAAERALRQVTNQKLDAIVVGGGDGSVRTVSQIVAGTGVPLGIVPLGTLNHFAMDLGLPLAVEAAVAVIAAGHTRFVDLGEVNGHIFCNNSSIGIYPYLVRGRERRRRKKPMTKWIANVLVGVQLLRHIPLRRLAIHSAGRVEPCRSPCVLVANNAYHLDLPGFGRRERLDGGELCIYVAKGQSRLALVWLACRTILGLLDKARDLVVLIGPNAEIHARGPRMLVASDGEVDMLRPPLFYATRPGALCVFAPGPARPRACFRGREGVGGPQNPDQPLTLRLGFDSGDHHVGVKSWLGPACQKLRSGLQSTRRLGMKASETTH